MRDNGSGIGERREKKKAVRVRIWRRDPRPAGKEDAAARREQMQIVLEWTLISVMAGWLFYDWLPAGALLWLAVPLYGKIRKQDFARKHRRMLEREFAEALRAMSAAVRAGYSPENAVKEAWRDLKLLHTEENAMMRELRRMISGLQMNEGLVQLFEEFAAREELEDAGNFAEVFREAKQSGGNLAQIMEDTVEIMEERDAVTREIEVLLAGRQYEQRVMAAVPAGMILYLRLGSPGYLDGLYHNPAGICVMTLAAALYAAGIYWGWRVLEVEV